MTLSPQCGRPPRAFGWQSNYTKQAEVCQLALKELLHGAVGNHLSETVGNRRDHQDGSDERGIGPGHAGGGVGLKQPSSGLGSKGAIPRQSNTKSPGTEVPGLFAILHSRKLPARLGALEDKGQVDDVSAYGSVEEPRATCYLAVVGVNPRGGPGRLVDRPGRYQRHGNGLVRR